VIAEPETQHENGVSGSSLAGRNSALLAQI
jgi:hypothetical protein